MAAGSFVLLALVKGLSRKLVLHAPAARRAAVRWVPYYVAKFAIVRSVRQLGAFRLYRRAVEVQRRGPVAPTHQKEAFLNALKFAIRSPASAHALLLKYDQMLWQWLQQMERSGAKRAAADRATSHAECAVNWQASRKERVDDALLTSSARLLLLASGCPPESTAGRPSLPESSGAIEPPAGDETKVLKTTSVSASEAEK